MSELNEYLTHLGGVIYYFQTLEASLGLLFASLINEDQHVGQNVISQLSFSRMLTSLDGIFRHKVDDAQILGEFEELLSRASEAEQVRNRLLHSIYLTAGDGTYDYVTRAKMSTKRGKGLRVHFENLTPQDLQKSAQTIKSVFAMSLGFIVKVDKEGYVDIPVKSKN